MEAKHPLVQRFERYNEKHEFKSGDLVMWKPGLKNRKHPEEGAPVVVVEVLPAPVVIDGSEVMDSGTPLYREPLDIKLGSIDPRGDEFMVYHYDSHRFMPYSE